MPVRNASKKYLSGREVKAWRLSRELSQPELAEWLGLTPQAVGKYETRGATKATALALSAIDRGLRPFKPTMEDLASIDRVKRIRNKETK
jgi:transcriptional regulator with XRE-family HTH domain